MATATLDKAVNWPLWWFATLESAIEQGDYPAAARAQRELERLGVTVRYRGRWPVRPEEAPSAC